MNPYFKNWTNFLCSKVLRYFKIMRHLFLIHKCMSVYMHINRDIHKNMMCTRKLHNVSREGYYLKVLEIILKSSKIYIG